jgi:RNA ligase (TIGR02306 family)
MNKSTHRAEVVSVVLETHPNADSLSIVRLYNGGFQVVVRTDEWTGKTKAIYIQPDSVVPDTEQFTFLDGKNRIKSKRLRGIWSMGLLIPAPDSAEIGQDFATELGIVRYEPPLTLQKITAGEAESVPRFVSDLPKYDVESLRRYSEVFTDGESVVVTEKIHGANGRWLWDNEENRLFAGSRSEWKKYTESNLWWKALENQQSIKSFLFDHPRWCVYGEIYGPVQDLKYGKNDVQIAIFDIMTPEYTWLEWEECVNLVKKYNLPWVPVLEENIPFHLNSLLQFADGMSQIPGASHIREGIVIRPTKERWNDLVGRVCLKIVSNTYLERS